MSSSLRAPPPPPSPSDSKAPLGSPSSLGTAGAVTVRASNRGRRSASASASSSGGASMDSREEDDSPAPLASRRRGGGGGPAGGGGGGGGGTGGDGFGVGGSDRYLAFAADDDDPLDLLRGGKKATPASSGEAAALARAAYGSQPEVVGYGTASAGGDGGGARGGRALSRVEGDLAEESEGETTGSLDRATLTASVATTEGESAKDWTSSRASSSSANSDSDFSYSSSLSGSFSSWRGADEPLDTKVLYDRELSREYRKKKGGGVGVGGSGGGRQRLRGGGADRVGDLARSLSRGGGGGGGGGAGGSFASEPRGGSGAGAASSSAAPWDESPRRPSAPDGDGALPGGRAGGAVATVASPNATPRTAGLPGRNRKVTPTPSSSPAAASAFSSGKKPFAAAPAPSAGAAAAVGAATTSNAAAAAAATASSSSDSSSSPPAAPSSEKKASVAKSLAMMLAMPTNRQCADCRAPLVDSSKIYASFHKRGGGGDATTTAASPRAQKRKSAAAAGADGGGKAASAAATTKAPNGAGAGGAGGGTDVGTFLAHHENFAPPGSETPRDRRAPKIDPAVTASSRAGGHGVFLCAACGLAHRSLGRDVARVKSVQLGTWTSEEVAIVMDAGGNSRNWAVYEAYMPDRWRRLRPNNASTTEEREVFARAKYEALAFLFPQGPLATASWGHLVSGGRAGRWGGKELKDLNDASLHDDDAARRPLTGGPADGGHENGVHPPGSGAAAAGKPDEELPNRLVDYFCVLGRSDRLERDPHNPSRLPDLRKTKGPGHVAFETAVQDCFPGADAHPDANFPSHVAKFVFPEGCKPSLKQLPPMFFTFVLTLENGNRMYGAALHVYDEPIETESIKSFARESGYDGALPLWMAKSDSDRSLGQSVSSDDGDGGGGGGGGSPTGKGGRSRSPKGKRGHRRGNSTGSDFSSRSGFSFQGRRSGGSKRGGMGGGGPSSVPVPDIVYLPRCLAVLSHYGFFDIWRQFLLQLYQITLVQAPLPIERYISNFVAEVPLPPQGRIEIKFGFTDELQMSIARPPPNRLPLAGFSYRPLFAGLSAGNVMVVMGCLLSECRVALCSRHYAMLGPVAEALLSLLFPFAWQGMYIPVLPYGMLDILDAPVPFLVGLHSRYLSEVKISDRPLGVVFVNLDEDIVNLGLDEGQMRQDGSCPIRLTPDLPDRDATKLKSKLEQYGGMAYLPPNCGIKGRIATGEGNWLRNGHREPYAHYEDVKAAPRSVSTGDGSTLHATRSAMLNKVDKAFLDNELIMPIGGFGSEEGQLTEREVSKKDRWKIKGMKLRKGKGGGGAGGEDGKGGGDGGGDGDSPAGKGEGAVSSGGVHLLDMTQPDGFNSQEIRNAFLRFFVAIFQNYEKFLGSNDGGEPFHRDDFLADLNFSSGPREFMSTVVRTQMFDRFIQDRLSNPDLPEVLFFDESIVAKKNRSKKSALKRKETPFLSDQSGMMTESYTPPPPSNWGLPDDGRSYHYGSFPKLDPALFGKVRPAKTFQQNTSAYQRRAAPSSTLLEQQQQIMSKVLKPFSSNSNESKHSRGTKGGSSSSLDTYDEAEKDVEWAIHTLAYKDVAQSAIDDAERKKKKKDKSAKTEGISVEMDVVPSAQSLLLSARRKQSILLTLIAKVQSYVRMHQARSRYRKLRHAVVCLQHRYRLTPIIHVVKDRFAKLVVAVVAIQRMYRGFRCRLDARKHMQSVARLQSWARGVLVRRSLARGRAAVTIQSWWRGLSPRERFLRVRWLAVRVQATARMRRVRFAFKLTHDLIAKSQASARRFLVRRHMDIFRQCRAKRYRAQIVELWIRARTPMSYRTKFWVLVNGTSFFHLGLLVSELLRLWSELGVQHQRSGVDGLSQSKLMQDKSFFQGHLMGIPNTNYRRYMNVQAYLDDSKANNKGLSSPIFPSEKSPQMKKSIERFQHERSQVYERLASYMTDDELKSIYKLFEIAQSQKKKKVLVAEKIWTSSDVVEESVKATLMLFPELNESTQVSFVKPSKKTQKRFRGGGGANARPKPINDKSMWVQARIDSTIKAIMMEVTRGCFLGMAGLIAGIEERDDRWSPMARFERQRDAIAGGSRKSWSKQRVEIVMDYLHLGSEF